MLCKGLCETFFNISNPTVFVFVSYMFARDCSILLRTEEKSRQPSSIAWHRAAPCHFKLFEDKNNLNIFLNSNMSSLAR